ncbi:MAG TPA: V-type ATPase subunit [Bacilli bacterium]|nr:V-type ATPase subunit [Bacilli bacterium]
MPFVSNALIAKIKTLHANDLTAQDYQELLNKKTIWDVALFLKSKDAYRDILSNVPESSLNRARLEGLIKRQKFDQLVKLVKFLTLKDRGFYLLNFVHMEHEIILEMIKSFISRETYDVVAHIPYYFDHYSKIDFVSLTKATDMDGLLKVLADTRYYKMLKSYAKTKNEDLRYYEFESIFENDYYNYTFKQIAANYRGKLRKNLENAFKSRIEMENMIKVYRLKKFYGVEDQDIKSILIPSTRIIEKKLDEIIAVKSADDIFKTIIESGLGVYLGDKDQVYLEYYTDHMRFNTAQKFMYYSNAAPTVFMAYMFFGELEVENLAHIIEGIHYELDEREIRSMLVF